MLKVNYFVTNLAFYYIYYPKSYSQSLKKKQLLKIVLRFNSFRYCHKVIVQIWIQQQDLYSTMSDCAAAESGGLCVTWTQCHSSPPWGVKHVCVVCHNVSGGGGGGGLCHGEEALNGKSWYQRSQLTTRTTTYWTKKPMEKQHIVYVIGFWVTNPIQVFMIWLQLWKKKSKILLWRILFTRLSHFSELRQEFSLKLKLFVLISENL